ncbi:pyridoxine 5'-phosphate synthase [Desulfovibrio psychrotolerans]|uniref:Pyridoxine 5'-phosphate synthase n=1 Tax=Desulfovibrio psychrotolerans TaxID=415242 RepID=A0A7J0BPM2_9BACT|nr:pyridoxine 5'-phosphate synthase [Desulfovibrio psychrotolerans]GFM35568.1 pyridoxine 5'-phosphate synthase [Desulfovibrio psychrotolerans]
MPVLVVNVDHVATLRQQRRGIEPEPVTAAHLAELAGARGIIVHLREDRRHIIDRDVSILSRCLNTRLHLEMAATAEMQSIALDNRPYMVCLVPEKREELTTEGGLAVAGRETHLREYLAPIHEAGICSSLFIEADERQIDAAKSVGSEFIEIHTGRFADAATPKARQAEFTKIVKGIEYARSLDLRVNLGHGLNYTNIFMFKDVPGIDEYSIGHSIVSRAVLVGMDRAVREMCEIIRTFAE